MRIMVTIDVPLVTPTLVSRVDSPKMLLDIQKPDSVAVNTPKFKLRGSTMK